ncbi:hypothetical protein BST27_15280 [Mycobacterium intermedium]|uniref:Uncharacterized protein n=1 Tax=Mycobacterium intermedium TaxID=28445 RepID=A0A1E3S8M7_MYCIE|nr:hypothetical protein [Mycobacterium intermedium]MCV6967684.1 hypothetical protein [Mycobacterium intermedium]ODQ98499.1 hypothetical protein BHQ20_21625 [Mycobacterium intermedium]OPE48086.1 hypothetical protein BV508_19470 [Mycobacterium intermedium]ORB03509.1 hypothetical protein BST27_15280 [Mycobacterium intermedium]
MLIGWRAVPRTHGGFSPFRDRRRGALALGSVAAVLLGIVGCTKVTEGTAAPDTAVAPAYRSSVSASVSASIATSSVRESQRQVSLTTKAIHNSCDTLATTSNEAIDKVNAFVEAFNSNRNTGPTEGPAIEASNNSATAVTNSITDAIGPELRNALNAYSDASRAVANAIATHAATGEFNRRVNQLNDARSKAIKLCKTYY